MTAEELLEQITAKNQEILDGFPAFASNPDAYYLILDLMIRASICGYNLGVHEMATSIEASVSIVKHRVH